MICHNCYNIWAVFHHKFCRVQGLQTKVCDLYLTYPHIILSMHREQVTFSAAPVQIVKDYCCLLGSLQACFAIPSEICCGFTIDHQRAKRKISSLWKELLSYNFLFVFIGVCSFI